MFNSPERKTALDHARQVVGEAKAAGRELTDAEQSQVAADMAKVRELDAKTKGDIDRAKRVMSLGSSDQHDPDAPGLFSAEAKAGIVHAAKTRTMYRTSVDAKAALTTGAMLPTSGVGLVPGLYPSAFPLSSLFTQEQAAGPVVRYYRFGAGSAAVVAEGAAKPDAGVSITPVDLTLEKLATTAQFSDEMAEDAPFLVSHLQQELAAAVATAENTRILATFAAASGILTGTGTTANVVDVVADAIAGAEAFSGKTPTAVVVHPSVLSSIRKSKASTAGSYMIDPTAPGPGQIHGVPLISTPAAAAATAWVVEASGVTIYRRGQLTVDIGTNADDWNHNLRTMRAEERVAAAVMRPSCLTKLTLT